MTPRTGPHHRNKLQALWLLAACAIAGTASAQAPKRTAPVHPTPARPAPKAPASKTPAPKPPVETAPAAKPGLSLHEAAAEGDLERVKQLLASGENVNAVGLRGDTPLLLALRRNNQREAEQYRKQIAVATYLIDHGANAAAQNLDHETALHYCAHWDQEDLIVRLKELGADVAAIDSVGRFPLHYAAEQGHLGAARLVTVRPGRMGKHDRNDFAPLDLAIKGNWHDVALYLLEARAPVADDAERAKLRVDECTKKGWTDVLDRMFQQLANKPDLQKVLIERAYSIAFADGNAKLLDHFSQARGGGHAANNNVMELFVAVDLVHENMVKQLLASGANPTTAEKDSGWTPLHAAALNPSPAIAQLLLDKKADPNALDHLHRTPLHVAAIAANPGVAARLLKAGADPARLDDLGNSPLHYAAQAGNLPLVRALKNAHAPTTPNVAGLTPLDLVGADHPDVQAVLLPPPLPASFDALVRLLAANATPEAIAAARERWAPAATRGTPLIHIAIQAASPKAAKQLLDETPARVNDRDPAGFLPIHLAAELRDTAILTDLLARGANVNDGQNPAKWTPLHFAAAAGNGPAVHLLLERGANRNAVDGLGHTPAVVAAQTGHPAVLN